KGVSTVPQCCDGDLVLRRDAIGCSSTLRYFERCGPGLALTRELTFGTARTRHGAVDVATDAHQVQLYLGDRGLGATAIGDGAPVGRAHDPADLDGATVDPYTAGRQQHAQRREADSGTH